MSLVWWKPPSHSPRRSLRRRPPRPTVPLLSVVVPTKNERDNVAALVERLEAALPTVAMEIIFVDDSDDGTRELVAALRRPASHQTVDLVPPRGAQRRIGGLGGAAVCQGMRRGARSVGLRDGRRPAAPAGAGRRRCSSGRARGDWTSSWRAATATTADAGGVRVDAGAASRSTATAAQWLSRAASGRHRPDERFLPGAPRGARPRRAAAAGASRSCSRSSSARRACARPRCRSRSASGGSRRDKASIREGMRYLVSCSRASGVRAVRPIAGPLPALSSTRCCSAFFTDVWGCCTSSRL